MNCSPWGPDGHTIETVRSFIQWHLEKALYFQFEFDDNVANFNDILTHEEVSSSDNQNIKHMLELEETDSDIASVQDTDHATGLISYGAATYPEVSVVDNVLSITHVNSVERIIVDRLMRQILIACSRTIAGNVPLPNLFHTHLFHIFSYNSG